MFSRLTASLTGAFSNRNLGRMIAVVLLAHVALKVVSFLHLKDSTLTGDEQHYLNAGCALGESARALLAFRPPDVERTLSALVGRGWFMPGMSILLLPLTVFDPAPGLGTVRLYIGLVTLLLFVWALEEVHRHAGRPYALGLVFFLGLSPMWTLFSLTLWGEVTGGLLVAILAARLVGLGDGLAAGIVPTDSQAGALGALSAAALLARSSALAVVPFVFLLLAALSMILLARGPRLVRALRSLAFSVLVFVALLLPWSLLVSFYFEKPVLTTTTLPMSIGVTFGDHDRLCGGPCAAGNVWTSAFEYSARRAAETGDNILAIEREMARDAIADLTLAGYFRRVGQNLDNYYLRPTQHMRYLEGNRLSGASTSLVMASRSRFDALTRLLLWSSLSVSLLAVVWLVRAGVATQVRGLTLKLLVIGAMFQPFVNTSHGRYWPSVAPLLALTVPFLASAMAARRASRAAVPRAASRTLQRQRWLLRCQAAVAALVILFVLALVVSSWS